MFRADILEKRIKEADLNLLSILEGNIPQDVVKSGQKLAISQNSNSTPITGLHSNHFVITMIEFTQLHNCLFESTPAALWTMHFVSTVKMLLNDVTSLVNEFEAEAYISRIYAWFCTKLKKRRELLSQDESKLSKPAQALNLSTNQPAEVSNKTNSAISESPECQLQNLDQSISIEALPVRTKTVITHFDRSHSPSRPKSPIRSDPMFSKSFSDQIMSKTPNNISLSSLHDTRQTGGSKSSSSKQKDSKSSKTDLPMLPKRVIRSDISNEIEKALILSEINGISSQTSSAGAQLQSNSTQRSRIREMSENDPSLEVLHRYMQSRRVIMPGSRGVVVGKEIESDEAEADTEKEEDVSIQFNDDSKLISWMIDSVLSKREMDYDAAVEKITREAALNDAGSDKKKDKPKESKSAKGGSGEAQEVPPPKLPPQHARDASSFMSTKFPFRWDSAPSATSTSSSDCELLKSARGSGGQLRRCELLECGKIFQALDAIGDDYDIEVIKRGILTPQDRPLHMCSINMCLPRDGLMKNPLPVQFHKKYKPMTISNKPKAKKSKKKEK